MSKLLYPGQSRYGVVDRGEGYQESHVGSGVAFRGLVNNDRGQSSVDLCTFYT